MTRIILAVALVALAAVSINTLAGYEARFAQEDRI